MKKTNRELARNNMKQIEYKWSNAKDDDFQRFYIITEEYYSKIVGGIKNRSSFVPYNISDSISDVAIACYDGIAIGCAGLKRYSDKDIEVKRVWVEPDYRGNHIAANLMEMLENRAKQQGFQRIILQTREIMIAAVKLYLNRDYYPIDNYPPYDKLYGAIYFAITLSRKFQISHYIQREWIHYILKNCINPQKTFDNWMNRDCYFANEVNKSCSKIGYELMINDGTLQVKKILEVVESVIYCI